jgi:NADH-ubiquinone oxidoreductase chain 5
LFSVGGVSFSFPLLVDKLSLIFACTVSLISFRVMLFTITYMSGDVNLEYFVYIVIMFVLSMNFLIFIPHLLMLLLG